MELLLGFLIAMSVTMALIPPLMQLAARFHFLDAPGQRKVHAVPIPRVGGIAMAAGMLLAFVLANDYAQPMPAYLAGLVVLLIFGICDDRYTISPGPKLFGQVIAALIVMIWGGVGIDSVTLVDRYTLPAWVAQPLTLVFLLGVTNAINLADGLDGLAGGTTLLSLSVLALLAFTSGNPFVGFVAVIIIGAILGFLRFNTHPARVFMGDGGSQMLGYSAGVLSVVLTQDPDVPLSAALPLLLLGIPIVDTLMVMTHRVAAGRSPFHADRNHIHHRLLVLGFDHHEAVVAIYALQGTLFVAAWFLRYESDLTILASFGAVSVATVSVLHIADRGDWRWRHPRPDGSLPASGLGRTVRWLRVSSHVPRWSLVAIALCTSAYLAAVAIAGPMPSIDVRVLAGVLGSVLGVALMVRWAQDEAGWIVKGALYIAIVIAVYFDRHSQGPLERFAQIEWLLFAVLFIAILLRFRTAAERRFRVTPLDGLVLFIAIAVPNLPGSIVNASLLGMSIAKLIAMLYGVEMLLEAAARWWRIPAATAVLLLATCAAGGVF